MEINSKGYKLGLIRGLKLTKEAIKDFKRR